MSNFKTATKQRIEAKRLHLEQLALGHEMRLKNNLDYAKGNGGKIMMTEALTKIRQKAPAAAAIMSLLGVGKKASEKPTKLSYIARDGRKHSAEPKDDDSWKSKIGPIAALSMPFITAYLKKRAFGMGLKGVKGLVRLPFLPFMKKRRR